MKTSTLIFGGAAGLAALWTAGWFVGKTVYVEPEADKIVEQLRSGDVFFSFDSRSVGGFPVAYTVDYQGVQVSDSSTMWRWSAESMSVSSGIADAGVVALMPSDASKLTIESALFGADSSEAPLVFDVLTEDMVVRLRQTNGGGEIKVTAALAEANQATGAALIRGGKLRIANLDAVFGQSADQMNLSGTLSASEVESAYTLSDDGVSETKTSSVMTGLKMAFNADNANAGNLEDFILADGAGSASLVIDGSSGMASSTGGPSAPPFSVDTESGAAEISVGIADGRAEYRTTLSDLRYASIDDGGSAIPAGAVTTEVVSMSLEMPLRKSVEPVPYAIGFTMENLSLDEEGWKQIDPAGAIDRTPLTFRADLGGGVRILTDLGGDSFGQSPVDVETIDIAELSLAGLGVSADITGSLNVAGNAAQPDGTILVAINGAFALIDQLVAGGLVPPAQAGLYRSVIEAYAEPGEGPDDLKAEIAVANGAVSINGQPLQ